MGTIWKDPNYVTLPEDWEGSQLFIGLRNEITAILNNDFIHNNMIGIKDPRIIHFLPLYEEAVRRMKGNDDYISPYYIVMDRNLDEVAESIYRRMKVKYDDVKAIYERYKKMVWNELAKRKTRVIQFADLVNNAKGVINEIAEFVGSPMHKINSLPREVKDFLEKGLKHYNYGRGNFHQL